MEKVRQKKETTSIEIQIKRGDEKPKQRQRQRKPETKKTEPKKDIDKEIQ